MKFKKRFLSVLLMLTCVFALTACGAEKEISDTQQMKIDSAIAKAQNVIEFTTLLVNYEDVDKVLADYNNVELGDIFTSAYSQSFQDGSFRCVGKGVRSALSSFSEGMNIMGSDPEAGTPEAVVDGDTIIVTVPVSGVNANGSVELIFSNDIYLEMKSCTMNLDETFGELMGKAGLNTLIGMGTVFIVLILISLIISCFSVIPKLQDKFTKKPEPVVAPQPAAPAPVEEELADDTELVAVIAAAIAAYEGTSADGFTVRSIKRANTKKWQRA